jgi:hypothetical protein
VHNNLVNLAKSGLPQWVCDAITTRYTCNDKSLFNTYHITCPNEHSLYSANNNVNEVSSICIISLQLGKQTPTLTNILHLTMCNDNLLSLVALADIGIKISITALGLATILHDKQQSMARSQQGLHAVLPHHIEHINNIIILVITLVISMSSQTTRTFSYSMPDLAISHCLQLLYPS